MTNARAHIPVAGRRYLIIGGNYKGRLAHVVEVMGRAINNEVPPVKAVLCDCWGGPTGQEIILKMSHLEV